MNCGAVGQPRDGDPRAAYGILDTATRTLTLLRVDYDVGAAQAQDHRRGLAGGAGAAPGDRTLAD